jgi:hypothetical protein
MMEDEQNALATTHGHATVTKLLLFTYHAWPPGKDEHGQWKDLIIL